MRLRLASLVILAGSTVATACGGTPSPAETDASSSGTTRDGASSGTSPDATTHGTGTADGTAGSDTTIVGSDTTGATTTDATASTTTSSTTTEASSGTTGELDEDRDGHPASVDCDDADPEVHPGAAERCNGLDDDCDPGTSEDGVASVDGQGSYPSLFAAVTAAAPGSEVRVCPGVWQENVGIPHALSLVSQGGAAVTIIDGGGVGPALAVSAGEVVVRGFTLTGGFSVGIGGGLSVLGTEPVTVEDCIVTGNASTDGAGIYAYAGANLGVTGTTIAGNTGGIGGGLAMQGDGLSGSLTITGCTIEDNVADEAGGGLVIVGVPMASITASAIDDNLSLDGGGLSVVDSMVVLDDTAVRRNDAMGAGGGLVVYPGTALVTVTNGDWGVGADDNTPTDVAIPGVGTASGYGVGASFQCDATGCT